MGPSQQAQRPGLAAPRAGAPAIAGCTAARGAAPRCRMGGVRPPAAHRRSTSRERLSRLRRGRAGHNVAQLPARSPPPRGEMRFALGWCRAGRKVATSGPRVCTTRSSSQTRRRLRPSSAATASTSADPRSCCRANRSRISRRRMPQPTPFPCTAPRREGAGWRWSPPDHRETSPRAGTPPLAARLQAPCSRTASVPNARSTRQRRPACSTTVPGTNGSPPPVHPMPPPSPATPKCEVSAEFCRLVHTVWWQRRNYPNQAALRAKSECTPMA